MEKYREAGAVGVALVAKLGDTRYYVGRENDSRSFLGARAHVLYGGGSRAVDAVRKRRRTEIREIFCKVMLTIQCGGRWQFSFVFAYMSASAMARINSCRGNSSRLLHI